MGLSLGLGLSMTSGAGATVPPLAMANKAGTTVTDLGASEYEVECTVGSFGSSSANSTTALTGDFIIRFQAVTFGEYLMGVTTDPDSNNNYDTIDLAIDPTAAGADVTLYENASGTSWAHPYSLGDYFYIKRTGSAVSIGYGGTDGVTGYTEVFTRTNSSTLYVDSAFGTVGHKFRVKRLA